MRIMTLVHGEDLSEADSLLPLLPVTVLTAPQCPQISIQPTSFVALSGAAGIREAYDSFHTGDECQRGLRVQLHPLQTKGFLDLGG
jgi:hypothetical protein